MEIRTDSQELIILFLLIRKTFTLRFKILIHLRSVPVFEKCDPNKSIRSYVSALINASKKIENVGGSWKNNCFPDRLKHLLYLKVS